MGRRLRLLGYCFTLGIVFALWILLMHLGSYVPQSQAVKVLEDQGYSNVVITEHSWFFVVFQGCDANDNAKFTASAINPAGKPIDEVIVCFGYPFKAGTIRSRGF